MKYAKKVTETERVEAIARLREIHPKGSTVFLVLRRVSRSGTQRDIATIAFRENDVFYTSFLVGAALGDGVLDLQRAAQADHVGSAVVALDALPAGVGRPVFFKGGDLLLTAQLFGQGLRHGATPGEGDGNLDAWIGNSSQAMALL